MPARRGDEPCAARPEEVAPRPIEEDADPVSEPDQIEDVDEEPREPRDEAVHLDAARPRDRSRAPDRRHRALVEVRERRARRPAVALALPADDLRDVARLLHRDGTDAGKELSILFEVRHVTDGE